MVLDPSFFDQRNKKRAGFFFHRDAAGFQSAPVGMTGNRGLGADDHNFACTAGLGCGAGSGLDYADDLNLRGSFDFVKGKSSGSVAGDDQEFGSLRLKVPNSSDGVVGDRGGGFGAVRQAGGVSEVKIVSVRNMAQQRGKHGEAADPGIEDADGGPT